MTPDPRIDTYIANAAPFAQPILQRLRNLVWETCPEAQETIKWSMPFWSLEGHPLCHMAAFKAHAAFGFWGEQMRAHTTGAGIISDGAMGSLGRLTSVADLPPDDVMKKLLRMAVEHVRARPVKRKGGRELRPVPTMPDDVAAAFEGRPEAVQAFAKFSPGHRREYLEWVAEAKRPETRAQRIATMVAQCAEAKPLHWKYQKK